MISTSFRIVPVLCCLMAAVLGSVPSDAQQWLGPGRIHGVVLGQDEQPLAGAKVFAAWAQAPDVAPPAVTTSKRGRFVIPRLAPGEWSLKVEAEGYTTSDGRTLVSLDGNPALRIVLRPLAEVSPSFAETPTSIMNWLTRGNSLLQQGQPAAARAEYEKALRAMPPPAQPEVLRAVARTHVEEGQASDAVDVLQRALVFGPDDPQSRRFFTVLMDALKRTDEAQAWLARLDDEGPDVLRRELHLPAPAPRRSALPMRLDDGIAADPPQPGRLGRYRVAFEEHHPLADLTIIETRHGYDHDAVLARDPEAGNYNLAKESFEVFVPQKPGKASLGLFVWVSPSPSGQPPEHFLDILTRHRVIWIGANDSGNARPGWDRAALALDAVHNMSQLYDIDPERIFVGGYSGGGRISTGLSVLFPEVFRGGFFVYGVNYFRDVDAPDKPGMVWPAGFAPPPRDTLQTLRKERRFVFLTGELDFNRLQTRTYERLYRKEGFRHTLYLEIPGAHHYSGVPSEWFERALKFLDNR